MADVVSGAVLGTAFTVLYDAVNRAVVGKFNKFKPLLGALQSTLDSIHPLVIKQMGDYNVKLQLSNYKLEKLEKQMREGEELICKLSKLRWWNRTKYSYNNKLAELDASLKGLLKHIVIQQARDIKENLFVARETAQQLVEFQRFNERLLRERTLLQEDAKDLQEKLLLALFNNGKQLLDLQDLIQGMMKPQEASQVTDAGKGDIVALFKELFKGINQLLKENVTNKHFEKVLKNIKSTITSSLGPLVEEIKGTYESLDVGQKGQVHRFTRQMRDGLELFHKCSEIGTWNIYKRLSCANKLIQWNESLQREIDLLVENLEEDRITDTEKARSAPSTFK